MLICHSDLLLAFATANGYADRGADSSSFRGMIAPAGGSSPRKKADRNQWLGGATTSSESIQRRVFEPTITLSRERKATWNHSLPPIAITNRICRFQLANRATLSP